MALLSISLVSCACMHVVTSTIWCYCVLFGYRQVDCQGCDVLLLSQQGVSLVQYFQQVVRDVYQDERLAFRYPIPGKSSCGFTCVHACV